MILYFAGGTESIPFLESCGVENILVSYYDLSKSARGLSTIMQHNKLHYFLDSGAFSAFTVNAKIDIDQYIAFIKQSPVQWDTYALLDVIGNPTATMDNLKHMEEQGVKPLPVFHTNSPLPMLHELCQKYDYFALGGLVPYARQRKKMQTWVDTCFSVIKEYWPKKVHGFGVNSAFMMQRYPWYSVDATSWSAGGRWGQVRQWKDGEITEIEREESPLHAIRYGTRTHRVKGKQDAMTRQNVAVLLQLQKHATDLWAQKGITWNR